VTSGCLIHSIVGYPHSGLAICWLITRIEVHWYASGWMTSSGEHSHSRMLNASFAESSAAEWSSAGRTLKPLALGLSRQGICEGAPVGGTMTIGDAVSRNLGSFSFQGRKLIQRLLVPIARGLDAAMSVGRIERDEDENNGNSAEPAEGTSSSAVLFAFGNLLIFVCLLVSTPVFGAYTLVLIAAALILHFLCFLSVLLVIKEETDVWDGLLVEKDRVFNGVKHIKKNSVLVLSALFLILFISIFAQQWDQLAPSLQILKQQPNSSCDGLCQNIQYLLATIYEIPVVGQIVEAIGKLVAPGWALPHVPRWFRGGIDFLTATYIFGVFKYVYYQRKSINDLITAFERSSKNPATLKFLVDRAERAPEYILGKLFESALSRSSHSVRLAYIKALFAQRIHNFAYVFVDQLNQEKNPNNKRLGLDELINLIKTEGRQFTHETTVNIFNALSKQIKLDHEISVQEKLNEASLALVELGWQLKSLGKRRMKRLLSLVKERGSADIRTRLRELLSRMSISQGVKNA
jgi:hypothetical protein